MWMPETLPVFYVCRRCRPLVPIHAYDELRAHLRVHHQIRELPSTEICLYEAFQDARFRAPRTLRVNRAKQSDTASVASQKSNSSNVSNPFRRQRGSNFSENHNEQNIDPIGINVGASGSGVHFTQSHGQKRTNSGDEQSQSSVQNRLKIPTSGGGSQIEDVNVVDLINSRVAAKIDAEIQSRMPLLNAEVNQQVKQAVQKQVPDCVRNTLIEYATSYDEYTNNSAVVVSTRSRLKEYLRRSLEETASHAIANEGNRGKISEMQVNFSKLTMNAPPMSVAHSYQLFICAFID